MDRNLLLRGHEKVVAGGIELDQSSFLVEAQAAVAAAADEVDDGEAVVTGNGEGALTGGVQGEVVDGGVAVNGERGKMDEAVGVKDGEGASGVGGDEVAGEGEVGRGVEGEGGDGGGVLVEGTEGGGGGEVVEVDGVVVTAGSDDRA